ncbi:MAG: transketolase [Candidatus Kapabacteria bacterium]|nr:transketolase [Candidatus Kapabacteria bacterium]
MTPSERRSLSELAPTAMRVREHILRMSTDGGCFTGASLSCVDLLVYLYSRFLNVTPETVADPSRDYLLLSKGHDVPALYSVFAELGFIDSTRLANHLSVDDDIYWHPNRNVRGVEFHSGSLGHLLSVGIGLAYDIKRTHGSNRVVVILGDGELNEGSVWEAMLVARALRLDNLIAIIDRNAFQANMRTEELIPLEPIAAKVDAFGWSVSSVDGHNFEALENTFGAWKPIADSPQMVIAATQRGRGVPSITDRSDRWFCNFTADEVEALIGELHGSAPATLKSETLIVR